MTPPELPLPAAALPLACAAEVDARLPAFRGDGKKLQQILINLLGNAIKFTPARGSVSLTARREPDGSLALCITDTGIGIARDKIEVALAPFGQVNSPLARKNDSVGLELPLSKDPVELHGGTLSIDSEPGAGTSVTLRFPATRFVEPGRHYLSGSPGQLLPDCVVERAPLPLLYNGDDFSKTDIANTL